ncbi:hypothetical protein GF382_00155 [Candidatus Falkowbacteria bacterium]|nr:hypothetical protein [Candidatus Falkowbacteria bacterium]
MAKFKKISEKIHQVEINNPKSPRSKILWTNITNPGKPEIEYLRKKKKYDFNLSELQASSAKAIAQRPEIRKNKDYFFMIIHFPVYRDNEIIAAEIDFFVGHGFLITLHNNQVRALNDFFNASKKEEDGLISYELESSAILLYEILSKLIGSCYELLDKNSAEIDDIESMIFSHNQKKAVSRILSLRRNVINIRKIIQNHKNILKRLTEMRSSIVASNKLKRYYYELIEHTKRIWEYSETQKETIDALHDTNESLLNYSINNVMKTLTVFSVIVFPLTLFAALFGMNTTNGMPFTQTENGFWIIIGLMGIATLAMLFFFAKKKWL